MLSKVAKEGFNNVLIYLKCLFQEGAQFKEKVEPLVTLKESNKILPKRLIPVRKICILRYLAKCNSVPGEVRFDVVTATSVKAAVFWDVASFTVEVYRLFKGF
jgi:hypothetical protein